MLHNENITAGSDTEKLIELLGFTHKINEAGFILPDGRLLHLQRSNSFKRLNHLDAIKLLPRYHDHQHSIIDTDMMAVMAKEQLVRFCVDGKIHTACQPTSVQMRKIYNTLAYRSSTFEIITSSAIGMTLAQHTVSGPSMATLVDIFKIYQGHNSLVKADEFFAQDGDTHFQLVFRPSMKVVGSINKKSKMLKIDADFKDVSKLFYRLITDL